MSKDKRKRKLQVGKIFLLQPLYPQYTIIRGENAWNVPERIGIAMQGRVPPIEIRLCIEWEVEWVWTFMARADHIAIITNLHLMHTHIVSILRRCLPLLKASAEGIVQYQRDVGLVAQL
ncbi:hypothetical protein EON65_47545 [archaeon]|nr:MAG: hypothetical protein EON65_47545 [archaeon]